MGYLMQLAAQVAALSEAIQAQKESIRDLKAEARDKDADVRRLTEEVHAQNEKIHAQDIALRDQQQQHSIAAARRGVRRCEHTERVNMRRVTSGPRTHLPSKVRMRPHGRLP